MKIATLLLVPLLCLVIGGCGPSKPPGTENTKPPVAEKSKPPAAETTTVVAWGNNDDGQATLPVDLSEVTAIAAGGQHTVALQRDGTVVAWGSNREGQTTIPSGLSGVAAIAAGAAHSVALKSDGTVVEWGFKGFKAQGETTVPAGLSGVTAIAAGTYHTVALKSDGTVVAWWAEGGRHDYGQATVPTGLSGVKAIAAGNLRTLALKSDGTVVAWGSDRQGQATGTPTSLAPTTENPVTLNGVVLSGVTAIAAGGAPFLAVIVKGHSIILTNSPSSQKKQPSTGGGSSNSKVAKTDSEMKAECGKNLWVIGMAAYSLPNQRGPAYSFSNTNLLSQLKGGKLPVCPKGGHYTEGTAAGEIPPTCSIQGHVISLPSTSTKSSPEPKPKAMLGDKYAAEKWLKARIESTTDATVRAIFWLGTTQNPPLMAFNGEMYSPRHKRTVGFNGYVTVRNGEWDMVDFKIGN